MSDQPSKTDFAALGDRRVTIQHARDVLAKWRNISPGPWYISPALQVRDDTGTVIVQDGFSWDLEAIVGTAGNPDLLDAIDGFLEMVESGMLRDRQGHALRIADAIIAADEKTDS